MVQMNFNAQQYDPTVGAADVFESGDYTFQIVQSEAKQTKAGTGTMLVFTCECVDPEHAKKRLTIRLNVHNPNAQAMEIAYRELSAISHVCGVLQWQDTQQLHGKPFKVRLEKKPRNDDPSKFGNEVKGYMDVNGNAPGGGQAPAAAAPPPPPSTPAAPPPAAPPADPAPAAAPPWQAASAPPAAPPAPAQPAGAPPAAAPPWAAGGAAPAAAPPWQQPQG